MLVLDEFNTSRTILEEEMLVLLRSSDVTGGCDRKVTEIFVGNRSRAVLLGGVLWILRFEGQPSQWPRSCERFEARLAWDERKTQQSSGSTEHGTREPSMLHLGDSVKPCSCNISILAGYYPVSQSGSASV